LSGRTALVTGAACRLGREVALALAAEGMNLLVHYRDSAAAAQQTAGDAVALGVQAHLVQASLDSGANASQLFVDAVALAGQIDVLVNNASAFPEDTCTSFSESACLDLLRTNALAPFELMRAMAAQQRAGCVINLLDTTIQTRDDAHFSYHLSKRLLHTLTCLGARSFAPAVRVNAIAPGAVLPPVGKDESYLSTKGDATPLSCYGSAEHVAQAAVYLARATFVTGQTLYIDGGAHLAGRSYD